MDSQLAAGANSQSRCTTNGRLSTLTHPRPFDRRLLGQCPLDHTRSASDRSAVFRLVQPRRERQPSFVLSASGLLRRARHWTGPHPRRDEEASKSHGPRPIGSGLGHSAAQATDPCSHSIPATGSSSVSRRRLEKTRRKPWPHRLARARSAPSPVPPTPPATCQTRDPTSVQPSSMYMSRPARSLARQHEQRHPVQREQQQRKLQ